MQSATKSAPYDYLLSLPLGYDAAAGRRWPLILFLHGAGERGPDMRLVAKHGPPKLLHKGARLSKSEARASRQLQEKFVVVSPRCPDNEIWNEAALLILLDEVCAKFRVDPSRVYLTGLSMGGYAVWSLGVSHPERFAAIVPVCGGGRLVDFLDANGARKPVLQSLGVWVFHGAQDPRVPLSESTRMVDILKQLEVDDLQYTIYPEAKHDAWTETYANPELYSWLLRHERRH